MKFVFSPYSRTACAVCIIYPRKLLVGSTWAWKCTCMYTPLYFIDGFKMHRKNKIGKNRRGGKKIRLHQYFKSLNSSTHFFDILFFSDPFCRAGFLCSPHFRRPGRKTFCTFYKVRHEPTNIKTDTHQLAIVRRITAKSKLLKNRRDALKTVRVHI